MKKRGFTLIEVLVVIAIIGILAAILVPVADHARKTAFKRRAMLEMNSIKVAIQQFYDDHRYMPWGDPDNKNQARIGDDVWTLTGEDRANVMRWLTGENPKKKAYLQIPEKSHVGSNPMIFTDPWGQDYRIGMDRNMDGAVDVAGTGLADWAGRKVMERVLVCSPGIPDKDEPLKTFDIVK